MGTAEYSGVCLCAVVCGLLSAESHSLSNAGVQSVDGGLIFGEPWNAQVSVDPTGFNEGFVHGPDGLLVLLGYRLQ